MPVSAVGKQSDPRRTDQFDYVLGKTDQTDCYLAKMNPTLKGCMTDLAPLKAA